jgi:hypothetical protein
MKEIKKEVRYLTIKPKIKALVDEVGMEYVLKYLLEYIDSFDIESDSDLWKFKVADSLEDAYDNYINRFKETEQA